MNRQQVLSQLAILFEDFFGVDSSTVGPETSPDSVAKWDSLNHVNLVAAIEQQFKVVLTPEDQSEMLSVDLILDILEGKLGSGGH